MLWQSVPLMTAIDVVIIFSALHLAATFSRWRVHSVRFGFAPALLLTVIGVWIAAAFFAADFVTMHVVPRFADEHAAMRLMTELHLNWSWIAMLLAIGTITLGTSRLLHGVVPRTIEALTQFEDAENRLSREIRDRTAELEAANHGLREANEALAQANARHDLVLEGSTSGAWDWDLGTGVVHYSHRLCELLDLDVDGMDVAAEAVIDVVHPEDRRRYRGALHAHLKGETTHFVCEIRVFGAGGVEHWILDRGIALRDGNGRALRMAGSIDDITDRKRAEHALRESESRLSEANRMFRLVLDTIPVRVFWKDLDGRFLGCNTSFANDVGRKRPEDVIGLDDRALPSAHAEDYQSDDREVVATGRAKLAFEEPLTKSDGTTAWLRTSKIPMRDASGEAFGLLGCYEDITESRAAREELGREVARRRLAEEVSGIGFWELNVENEELWFSDQAYGIYGLAPGTPMDLDTKAAMTHPDDRATFRAHVPEAISNCEPYEFERRVIRADGEPREVYVRGRPMERPGEVLKSVFGIVEDVTDRNRIAREHELTRSLLVASMEQSPAGVLVIDAASERFTFMNRAASEILYGPRADDREAVPPPERPRNWRTRLPDGSLLSFEDSPSALALSAGETTRDFECIIEREDGETRWILVNCRPTRGPDGKILAAVAIFLDITRRKADERAIRRLNTELEERVARRTAELEASNRELEAFSYSVSHDLRAPLRHVSGYLDLLVESLGTSLDDASGRYLRIASESAQEMGDLIDDLLSLSRVGRTELERKRIDLRQLVNVVRADLASEVGERDVEWRIGDLGEVRGDPTLLRLLLQNLLGNAVKFTAQASKAVISVDRSPGSGPDGSFSFEVRDNGVGFDPRYTDKLFGAFQRLHSTDEFEGSGIGLAIVQRIVNRHGGTVRIEGVRGEGATVYFSLGSGSDP